MPMPFDRFKQEGDLIGRMILEYGELEWMLCLMAGHLLGDLDTAIKSLYRSRGELQRMEVADALIRQRIENAKLCRTYEQTFAHMKECKNLRNQYAHTNWLHAGSDKLCYIAIEEMAKSNEPIEMDQMTLYHLDLETVKDQARFFTEVMQNMAYLNMEVQFVLGSSTQTGFHYVPNIMRPKKAIKMDGLA
ncbi:hypothetical protein RM533_09910 [Croceicoccus sp. F390]|uniref:HEPN AbiU2-like domain-containing protein n=1 Tax=Croceicoccus esteveae TaxID=3075597 RepID=A0ABU2ZIR5_9SPHN|nr:hypothetical protein [Croceicoccus sp. F390]MDT0576502.1 hypothetical protein [Croceicoccus sp. F390]